MNISFLGASETVTGSCYLVESGDTKLLVDCGMFQGVGVESRNKLEFKFDPREIDFVLLTHAHLDHCGLLPKLVKNGFKGKIYLTPPTAEIAQLILMDSAKIQEGNERRDKDGDVKAIYGTNDSLNTISKFESIRFNVEKNITPNIRFKFIRVGHVLGAASILLEIEGRLIVFSGDIGRRDQTIIKKFKLDEWSFEDNKSDVDFVVMETLYAGLRHPARSESEDELIEIINKTIERNGNVMIPVFSLHRLQEISNILIKAYDKSEINQDVQIFSDSPLGNKVTDVYTSNPDELDGDFGALAHEKRYNEGGKKHFGVIQIVKHHRHSLGLTKKKNAVILAGSGMAVGGRIISHLYSGLKSPSNSVIMVGFQAEGTLGRALAEGSSEVEIFKHKVSVKAKIHYLRGFSAHADHDDLNMWLDSIPKKDSTKIFLVHAEEERSKLFEDKLKGDGLDAVVPKWNEIYTL